MTNIAIFASGSGSNAENIANHFKHSTLIDVKCIISNKSDAYVLDRANKLGIESKIFTKMDFENPNNLIKYLSSLNIDYIILAGFLLKIPQQLIELYPNKIINIHPALLPKYGGKGMYGDHVHKKVIENKESESGITIHYVNKNYDEGTIIVQRSCEVLPNDNYKDLAQKVHKLEYEYYPKVIEDIVSRND